MTIFESRHMAGTKSKGSVQMFIQYNTLYEKYQSTKVDTNMSCDVIRMVFTNGAFFTVSGSRFQLMSDLV